jgi:hypothetical protein
MAQHVITSALLHIEIPTSFCHSPNDRVVIIDNLPSNNDMSTNANLQMYNPPLAFLRPTGNHFTRTVACAIDPILTYRITNLNQPLPNPPATCPSRVALPVCATLASTILERPTLAPGAVPSINDDSSSDIRVVIGRNGFLMYLVGLVLATVFLSIM